MSDQPTPERFELTHAHAMDLVMAIATRDTDTLTDWMTTHVTSWATEYAVMSALPQLARMLLADVRPLADGEMWAMEQLPTPGMDAEERARSAGVGQLITAGMNNDADAIYGHVDALMTQPDSYRLKVLADLCNYCSQAALWSYRANHGDVLLHCDGCKTGFEDAELASNLLMPGNGERARERAAAVGWTHQAPESDYCPTCTTTQAGASA